MTNLNHHAGSQLGQKSALRIDGFGDWIKMIWIHTSAHSAEMVKVQARRNRPFHSLINDTMSTSWAAARLFRRNSIAVFIQSMLPNKTQSFVSSVLDKIFRTSLCSRSIMTMDKHHRNAFYAIRGGICFGGDFGFLAASAAAKSVWNFHIPLPVGRQRKPGDSLHLTSVSMADALCCLSSR